MQWLYCPIEETRGDGILMGIFCSMYNDIGACQSARWLAVFAAAPMSI